MSRHVSSSPASVDIGDLAPGRPDGAPGRPDVSAISRLWGLALVVIVGVVAAVAASTTPSPRPADAPSTAFSAVRAMADVRAIAARPHPSGSPEAARVRDHIAARLQGLGLATEVQHAEGVLQSAKHKPGVVIAGRVDNVIGVLRGRDRNAPALLIMSHYDTMPNSPGAGDDTVGAAAALEIARVLGGQAARQRDVIFLFTDGEEPGLLGAQAFFSSHPLARRVGLALNLEARGDAGRVVMFESNPQAGALIRRLGATSPAVDANSLMTSLYRLMANDTDLTVALDRGYAGLNFAIGGDQLAYHTSLTTPDHLDQGSLQQMGDAVLPMAIAFATAQSLPGKAPDLTYSDVMGRWLVAYPPPMGWGLIALSALLVAFVVVQARTRAQASVLDMTRGAGALLAATLASALVLHLCGRLLGGEDSVRVYALVARYRLLLAGCALVAGGVAWLAVAAVSAGWRRLPSAVAVIAIAAACSLSGLDLAAAVLGAVTLGLTLACLGRPTSLWGLWSGSLILGLVLAVGLQAMARTGGFIVQWPLLLGALAAAVCQALCRAGRSGAGWTAAGLVAAAAMAQICYWAGGFFLQIGPVAPEILAFAVPLALFGLAPGLHAAARRQGVAGLGAVAVGALLLVLAGAVGWGVGSPRQLTQLFFLSDPQKGLFRRVSATKDLDPWSRATLGAGATSVRMPLVASGRIWTAPTPPVALPGVGLSADAKPAGSGFDINLHVRPGALGRQLKILIQPTGGLQTLTLNGRPLEALKEAQALSLDRLMIVYTAPPADGIVVGLHAGGHGGFKVVALESRDGWPAGAEPTVPRPRPLLTWGLSDTTVVQGELDYRW